VFCLTLYCSNKIGLLQCLTVLLIFKILLFWRGEKDEKKVDIFLVCRFLFSKRGRVLLLESMLRIRETSKKMQVKAVFSFLSQRILLVQLRYFRKSA